MLSNVLVLVHGSEVDHSTNRLYINKQVQMKGFGTKDFVFDNKFEGRKSGTVVKYSLTSVFCITVTYPRYALNLKLDQAVKIDQRLIKGVMNVQMDNVKVVDSELALIIAPKDPKNLYELTAKVR